MTPAEARALFPITSSRAYLFSGGLAPAAMPVRAALDRWSEAWALNPAILYDEYPAEWASLRVSFAALLGAQPDEIAITDNTSRGSNLVVQMLDAPPGSNVVMDEYTYFSSFYPWRMSAKAHVEARLARVRDNVIPFDDLAKLVDDRTVAVSITHVSWQNGFRHNLAALAELAHTHGAVFIVDAAQSAGALDIDVRKMGIDFLACPALKWLLGTPGIGYLYVSREQTERLTPVQAAYTGVVSPFDPTLGVPIVYQPNATRYEVGMPSLPGMAASREGIELLRAVGMADVERQVLDLSGYCIERLRQRDLHVITPEPAEQRAGVIGLGVARCDEAAAFLRERGVDVYAAPIKSLLRIDPHVFNNRAEIDRLLNGLDEFLRREGRDALRP